MTTDGNEEAILARGSIELSWSRDRLWEASPKSRIDSIGGSGFFQGVPR